MIDFSPLARERVCEVYAVSNTPAYLVRKLRGEPSTLSFARANSADDLIGLISGKDSKEVRTLEDVALAYAAMVALTYKGHANFEKLSRLRPKEPILVLEDHCLLGTIQNSLTRNCHRTQEGG